MIQENSARCYSESEKGDGVGGGAMGLATFMPAWKGILKDEQIEDLDVVEYIRTLAAPPGSPGGSP